MRRVIRVGGSLLTWREFPTALDRWLSSEQPARNILVAGGGPWVELLRAATERFDLSDTAAHWLCIRAMSVTAGLLAEILTMPLVTKLAELGTEPTAVLDVCDFLRVEEPLLPGVRLPATWDVTSDSIAARVARAWDADELVLLKSKAPPAVSGGHDALATQGYVDRFFPRAAAKVKVRFVNLRELTGAHAWRK